MIWQSFSLRWTSLTLTLTLQLLSILPLSAQTPTPVSPSTNPWGSGETSAYDPPPDLGSPTRTESGGKRPPLEKCPSDRNLPNPPLTALIPNNSNVTLTLSDRPKFFFYIPETSAKTAEFVIKDENDNDIYRTDLTIPNRRGIFIFNLPANAPTLEIGKNYQWYFAIRCTPDNSLNDLAVSGWIWRTQLRPDITNELQKAQPRDRARLYRQYKIWHEALASIAELRRSNPNDSQLVAEWQQLFTSAGLSEFKELPILGNGE